MFDCKAQSTSNSVLYTSQKYNWKATNSRFHLISLLSHSTRHQIDVMRCHGGGCVLSCLCWSHAQQSLLAPTTRGKVLNSPLDPSTMNFCTAGICVRWWGRTACVMVNSICPAATEMRSGICRKCTVMEEEEGEEGEKKTLCMWSMRLRVYTHMKDKRPCHHTTGHGQQVSPSR